MSASDDALAAYRAKRSPDRTPEPFSGVASPGGRAFVVHKHAARNMHFDLRLEMDGVLLSWAVPRGPSFDPADKRLAMHVEDHPLEYGDFEGIIPAGNYGAGGVIVWDRGEWTALEDVKEGFAKGKLLFELRGYKLHGKWTLVKLKKGEKEWLLIKERDAFVKSPGDRFNETSVKSGLTVEEVRDGITVGRKLRAVLDELDEEVVVQRVDPHSVEVQLAELAREPFTRDGWIFELKLDGYRLLASKVDGQPLLLTRNGNDYTGVFPEVARAIRALPLDNCIVDGEVVVLDADGKPSFSRLQKRGRLTAAPDVRRAASDLPATFFAFDLIAFDDRDLRNLPLLDRKRLLATALPSVGPIRVLDHIEREGEAYLAAVQRMNLEGIIAKKADAPYRGGRSKAWCKIKAEKSDDFVIVGYTAPKNVNGYFGALQLADYVNGDLVYAGRVGTGFTEAFLRQTLEALEAIERDSPPCLGPLLSGADAPLPSARIPETKTTTWVEPRLVCEVRYREMTPDGLLRHAAFLRMRDDKSPRDCERQMTTRHPERSEGSALPDPEKRIPRFAQDDKQPAQDDKRPAQADTTRITNPTKIYWPAEKYTKSDLIEYYRSVSPWLLPYLRNRPVVMTRFPDGIDGKSFYQKDAPDWTPEWVRTVPVWSTDTQKEIRYFVADDVDTITYLANLGTIPLHMWLSRVGTLEQPDTCVIDLDPKDAPFRDVVRCALVLRKLCEQIGMPSYVKTTGKSGLHILLPLGRQCTYEQSRMLGQLLAQVMLMEVGDIATITRHIQSRGDKVYLDFLQNRHGQLIVAPYSVRPLPKAPVSMPLVWDEVDQDLYPGNYTIRNAVERMERMGFDPVLPALDEKVDLGSVLQRLTEAVRG
ncbi:MAG TPA: DNA ligase D [Gemmatimonadaceae bacterium]|nr:DNA ligase D [Gemmatimonadaceae bacterium]